MDFSEMKGVVNGIVSHYLTRGRIHCEGDTPTFGLNNSTWTPVPLGSQNYDTHDIWTTASTTIVVPAAGIYYVTTSLSFAGNTTGTRYLRLIFNGVEWMRTAKAPFNPAQTDWLQLHFAHQMPAGGTFQLQGYQSSGGSINSIGGRMTLVRLSY